MRHPELPEARENRDFVFKQICEAVKTISSVAHGARGVDCARFDKPGDLAALMDAFDVSILFF